MIKELQIPVFDLASSLTSAMDLIDPALGNHHKQVAHIAFWIATPGLVKYGRKADNSNCKLMVRKSVGIEFNCKLLTAVDIIWLTLELSNTRTTAHFGPHEFSFDGMC